jgi:hypothetical protein
MDENGPKRHPKFMPEKGRKKVERSARAYSAKSVILSSF